MTSIIKTFAQRDARLTKERQSLIDDVKDFTYKDSTPADFKEVSADEFTRVNRLMKFSLSEYDWQKAGKIEAQWSASFLQAQLDEPNQLETLLDAGTLTADVIKLKQKPLLQLLHDNPKPEWCRVVASVDGMMWQPQDMMDFPIELCRAFINNEKPEDEQATRCRRATDVWLKKTEVFYCHLVRIFFDRLTVDEKRQAARKIHANSIQTCPPGSRVQLITASLEEDGDYDLLHKICDAYANDPLSIVCKDLRQLLFRSSIHRGFNDTPCKLAHAGNNCDANNTLQYLFPDLCYVFPTEIRVRYHTRIDGNINDDVSVYITSGEYPYIKILDADTESADTESTNPACSTDDDLKEKLIIFYDSNCYKSIQITAPGMLKVHQVRVYGSMLLLF